MAQKAEVKFDPAYLMASQIANRITELGYPSTLLENETTGQGTAELTVSVFFSPILPFFLRRSVIERMCHKYYQWNNIFPIVNVLVLQIEGMTCASCVHNIESHMMKQAGVISATVALATSKGKFVYDTEVTGPRDIIETISVSTKLDSSWYFITKSCFSNSKYNTEGERLSCKTSCPHLFQTTNVKL